jgi:SPP1 family predicted phage head-tail adaptor
MDPDRRDRRIALLERQTITDDWGQPLETYVEIARPWANVADLRGGEHVAAAQVTSQMVTRFRIQYRRGITPLHRLRYDPDNHADPSNGLDYDILQNPIELGRRDGLELLARARTD